MSHGTSTTVECPLCGASFDPSAAGGWCTNSNCGDWQYEGDDASDFDEETSGTERTAADGGTTPSGVDGDEPADETPGDAADDSDEATDDSDDQPDLSCPACGGDVEAGDNFCRTCGTNVSHLEPGSTELSACPACEGEVEPADSFCGSCGENLDAYRPGVSAQAAPPGRSNGAVGTGESAASAETASTSEAEPEAAAESDDAVESDDAAASDEAAESGDGSESDDGPRLALVVRNREIQVGDGDTVGRKIRSIIMDTGGDEEDAVRVHREHIQFERTDEQFHVVDLGRNPTIVNGERLEQGDRVPVSPGDRIELSGIANIQVQSA